ncbi:tyrosine-protein phosphatase [Eubacterium sp. 1001713B170207_170306_E7]|uniref:tyrosine-protein phosphatase n=1 Tax=Eubacterium sp. 1001713B170207_170306_E7 TaxID=2787097 RepID=UPI0018992936|nr:tyrosine-protein phosphatase [Eubacterium sp. 1001713B170207_170306_E7]
MLNYKEYQIELDGCHNFRDLGGFPAAGDATCYEVAYRSDALGELSKRDIACMKDLGISTIIDLRTPEERSAVPDVVASDADFDYITLSLMDQSAASLEDITQLPALTDLYISLLENQSAGFKKIGQIILDAPGGVVFHCTAGKDRTGVTAALLLGLAGVERPLIVDSYAKSAGLMRKKFRQMQPANLPKSEAMDLVAARLLGSEPEYMETTLNYLERRFKSAGHYFQEAGLSAGETADLRERLVKGA